MCTAPLLRRWSHIFNMFYLYEVLKIHALASERSSEDRTPKRKGRRRRAALFCPSIWPLARSLARAGRDADANGRTVGVSESDGRRSPESRMSGTSISLRKCNRSERPSRVAPCLTTHNDSQQRQHLCEVKGDGEIVTCESIIPFKMLNFPT